MRQGLRQRPPLNVLAPIATGRDVGGDDRAGCGRARPDPGGGVTPVAVHDPGGGAPAARKDAKGDALLCVAWSRWLELSSRALKTGVVFTGDPVIVTIHLRIRAISEEELRFCPRSHLTAMLPTITLKPNC
jgi:hypothetical protein